MSNPILWSLGMNPAPATMACVCVGGGGGGGGGRKGRNLNGTIHFIQYRTLP